MVPNFIRKIELTKWKPEILSKESDITADAITKCLRTTDNTLSIWEYDKDHIDEAILAISSYFDKPETVHFVTFTEKELEKYGLKIENTVGNTHYQSYKNKHFDICELDYYSLGFFSEIVRKLILDDNNFKKSAAEIKELIAQGIIDQKVSIDDLTYSEKERAKLDKVVDKLNQS